MKTFIKGFILTMLLGIGTLLLTDQASAHGYVKEPASRAFVCSLEKQIIGWSAATEKCGKVVDSPQSVEYLKGFPISGPPDGRIASGNGGLGQIDYGLDKQTADYWAKQDIHGGLTTFTWHYTAAHRTSKWHYYITKKGWNPDKPLTRADFELIGTVQHDGSSASTNLSHEINVPTDRNGYHVILAVWDVFDTANAFYNVIDVNLINSDVEDTDAPSAPTNLNTSKVTDNTVELYWKASNDDVGVKEYKVYRNNVEVGSTSNTTFTDKNLIANTAYEYSVTAIDFSGKSSPRSKVVKVTTQSPSSEEKPPIPTGLHTMKVTADSVELMWTKSDDNVKEYEVYRNNKKIANIFGTMYTDSGLKANTSYNYSIKAINVSGIASDTSKELTVKTKEADVIEPSEYRVFKLGSISNPVFYGKGEIIEYKGKLFQVLQQHYNYGDYNWSPDIEPSLWKPYRP